ncbi:MAG: 5-formyltetrahydrofolate cyclo-ligase [Methanoculleaceae archaeon]
MDPSIDGGDPALPKSVIRQRMKSWRATLPPELRSRFSRRICRNVATYLEPYRTVLVYMSKPPEVDTRPLATELLKRGVRLVVPIIERETRSLRLSQIGDLSHLVPSTFNVPEPIGSEVPVDPMSIEAAVIPMIAFDRSGSRLGYGAGYFDRFLSQNRHINAIGIAFSGQEVDRIPPDPLDIPMDCIITEREIIIISPEKD